MGEQIFGAVTSILCLFIAGFVVGHYFGWKARKKCTPTLATPAVAEPPIKLPLPSPPSLIFGEHHFIQFSADEYHKTEPWCLCRYDMKDAFYCHTESEARELMERADAYRSAH